MSMKIAVGADHAGVPLNQTVIAELKRLGHEVVDCHQTLTGGNVTPSRISDAYSAMMLGSSATRCCVCPSSRMAEIERSRTSACVAGTLSVVVTRRPCGLPHDRARFSARSGRFMISSPQTQELSRADASAWTGWLEPVNLPDLGFPPKPRL